MFKLVKASLWIAVLTLSLSAADVLVTVNGKDITKEDAQAFINATVNSPVKYDSLKPEEQNMVKERLIEKILLGEMAKKEGIEKDSEYQKSLEAIKNDLMLQYWMKKQRENVVVSDSEAKEFYEKNKKQESLKARHILLKTEKEAQGVINTLKLLSGKALEEKFIELAKTKSTGPTASKGGDLGTFRKGQMVAPFENAVWALKEGTITMKPVKTQFGWHVIYLEKRNIIPVKPYEEIKPNIMAVLKQKQFQIKMADIIKVLKNKATIVDHTKKQDDKKDAK